MGFFRRYKLTDYTADECRAECSRLAHGLSLPIDLETEDEAVKIMEKWACLRELLARHEKNNESILDSQS